jgi:hypothetical protein
VSLDEKTIGALRALNEIAAAIFGEQPSYRYFRHGQWRFGWTTERVGNDKYAAFIYRPIGPGSQSGKAKRWKLIKEVRFKKRCTAKARALLWQTRSYKEHPERENRY